MFPVGKGLTVDFGKFASSLGIEGSYTKDQINYSRSYWFNFLPVYHMGIRANFKLNDALAVNYWTVNVTQQTEPLTASKINSSAGLFSPRRMSPGTSTTTNVNYYLGQEYADVLFFPNGGAPASLPTQQRVSFEPIPNAPRGKLHILNS